MANQLYGALPAIGLGAALSAYSPALSSQANLMPSLNGLAAPQMMHGQYNGQQSIAKLFRKKGEEIIAWYTVCGKQESKHPFAISIVKVPRTTQHVELYIDNKLKTGMSGSDGIVDIYHREFDIDKPIVGYMTRCPSNA